MSNEQLNSPEVIYEIGEGSPIVVFNVGTHGNEPQPVIAARSFAQDFDPATLLKGTLRLVVSNLAALKEGKRFLDEDLNRAFPGDLSSSKREARLAPQILGLVSDADYVVDLHTAPDPPPFVILGARNESRLKLAESVAVQDIVLFEATEPCAMVDFTECGIGIEIGSHEDSQSADLGTKILKTCLARLGLTALQPERSEDHRYYEIFTSRQKAEIPEGVLPHLKNFQPVAAGLLGIELESDFVFPVLCGDKDYSPTYCYLAKQVTRKALGGKNE